MDPRVMDKSWMRLHDRLGKAYKDGVDAFLKFAVNHWEITNNCTDYDDPIRIPCPCKKCLNCWDRKVQKVKFHLVANGINPKYTKWTEHGEEDVLSERSGHSEEDGDCPMEIPTDTADTIHMVEQLAGNLPDKKLKAILDDAKKPLYGQCSKFTKLSSMCELFNLKSKYGASDSFFNELLPLLKKMLPPDNELVQNTYEAKRLMKAIGSEYEKIHVCINDCILYRDEHEKAKQCPTCGESRWKVNTHTGEVYENTPAKVLWYFPIIPRFKAYFLSEKTSSDFIWHHTSRKKDVGVMRHPADSPAWKAIDEKYPEIAVDPRNLRLGVSADGVDVNKGMHNHRSVWPVLTVIYNLPPWLCMKRKFIMLSLLIDGGPCKNIDVMLEPFVKDLKKLFEGVECFDARNQENFTLRAVVLWTINDYPALGTLCGCSYSGRRACVVCGVNTSYVRLKHSGKEVYTDHRRYLPLNHPFRYQMGFNGKVEDRLAPNPRSGEQIYAEVSTIQNSWGKGRKDTKVQIVRTPGRGGKMKLKRIARKVALPKQRSARGEEPPYWKKFNIWFKLLPYWKHNLVHHCLDFMHVEKNVCDSIVGTLLNTESRTKDHYNARLDLQELGIREELHPKEDRSGVIKLPAASFTLSTEEKDKFFKTLSELRVPQGYCSNFSSLVSCKDRKFIGLKSHDCHMLMQQFLPVAIKSIMPQPTRYAIMRFCYFFKAISSKEIKVEELHKLQADLCETLCLLEKYFPPSFFDIMIHLTVHLTREVELCGPVCFRWMYPFERCMKVIKGHVRNKNKPGGSIAEGNVVEETIEMFGEYQRSMKTVGIPPDQHNTSGEDYNSLEGKAASPGKLTSVSHELWKKAHLYVLRNTQDVEPYIERHMDYLRSKFPNKSNALLQKQHCDDFGEWLKTEVGRELDVSRGSVTESLRWLSKFPGQNVTIYDAYQVNGYLFRTKSREGSVYQNSGVYVQATDTNINRSGEITFAPGDYYGVLQEIWVLTYHETKITLFKCDWVDNNKGGGVSTDRLGYTLVDLDKLDKKGDPFILASQARQVFYVKDQENHKKSIVFKVPPKNYIDAYDNVDEEFSTVTTPRNDFQLPPIHPRDLGKVSWKNYSRRDVPDKTVRKPKDSNPKRKAT